MSRAAWTLTCCVVSILFLSLPNSAESGCFLGIEGVKGESVDARHRDEIDISGWSIAESMSSPSPASRGPAGRVKMQEFRFAARTSKASPILFRFGATGQRIANAVLSCRKADADQQDFLRIRFDDVVVSSFQAGVQPASAGPAASPQPAPGLYGDGHPQDQVGLSFSRIFIEYRPQAADGKFLQTVTGGFDLRTNRAQ